MNSFKHIALLLLCLVLTLTVEAQTNVNVIYRTVDSAAQEYVTSNDFETKFSDIFSAMNYVRSLVESRRQEGYLSASVDSFELDTNQIIAHLFIGNKFRWTQLTFNEHATNWLQESGINPTSLSGKPINPASFNRIVQRVLKYGENHGFPFAVVKLDNVETSEEDIVSGTFNVMRNRYFEFDTIAVLGDARVSKSFLYQYLGIEPDAPYSEKLASKIREKLAKLPFTTITANPRIYFTGQRVQITLYLKHRRTDQADGIVGFAPNTTGNQNSLLITGEVNLSLKNLLRRGIGYDLHWKSFAARSQQLKMNSQIPYLLKSPVGVDGNFEYVKFDTQFFTLKTKLGVRYLFEGTDYMKLYVQNTQSALIFADTSNIRSTRTIPTRNPVSTTSYGIQLKRSRLDNPLNPRKGFDLEIDGNVGRRNVLKDIRIEQVQFLNANNEAYSVYDSIKLKSLQAEFSYDLSLFFPIGKKSTLVGLLSGKQMITETVFVNDLYRFGGTNSLRGFNEESLLANSVTIVGIEYRYILGENAFFQLFANAAYTEDKSNPELGVITDIPFGFGAGVHLDVNAGILSLAYALGSEQGNGIKFNQAKIHFGIINYL
ncbi:MAG: outer membrane protein assembly factor BamA [Bacteroidia bacterium]|jgi:outer membrane protein assembly factor BamA